MAQAVEVPMGPEYYRNPGDLLPLTISNASPPQGSIPPEKMLPPLPKLTHFLCIPLYHAQDLSRNLDTFNRAIDPLNIHARSRRPAVCLHLHIGDLSLTTPKQLREARSLLASLDLSAILKAQGKKPNSSARPAPLRISLKGIDVPGHQELAYARDLFTTPHDATNRLQPFCEAIKQIFTRSGLAQDWPSLTLAWRDPDPDEVRQVKPLRANVVDALYSPIWGDTFDATQLLENKDMREFVFAEDFVVKGVAIWERREMNGQPAKGYREVAFAGFNQFQDRARL